MIQISEDAGLTLIFIFTYSAFGQGFSETCGLHIAWLLLIYPEKKKNAFP